MNKALVPSPESQRKYERQLAAFLEIVEVIPAYSSMRDPEGMLKPHYTTVQSLFDAGNLWNDAARIAQAATSTLTSHSDHTEVTVIRADKAKIIDALRTELAQSADHERTFRAFASNVDRQFEDTFSGRPSGWHDSDDIHNFNVRNEIAAEYLRHLKPDWLDENALKSYGLFIILAVHLADQILRRRYGRRTKDAAVSPVADKHPARIVAAVRVMAEFLSSEERKPLIPDDEAILARYLNFEFHFAAMAAVSKEAMERAQTVDAENAAKAPPDTPRKELGKIYEEISRQMQADYTARHRPQSAGDILETVRQRLTADIFSSRLNALLDRAITEGTFGAQLKKVLVHPGARRRIAKLTRNCVLDNKPPMRVLQAPHAG